MGHREVNGVLILSWPAGCGPQVTTEVRAVLEERGAVPLLVDMSSCGMPNADQLEGLIEAQRICVDRQSKLGLFGVDFSVQQLMEILGLDGDLPPILGASEGEALAAFNGNGAPPVVEFEIDLATAPTQRFDPQTSADQVGAPVSAPTARFDPGKVQAAAVADEEDGLLAIHWGDLASQGYVIGGEGGEEIMAAVADAGPAAPAQDASGEVEIDLGDTVPASFGRTAVMPAFEIEDEPKEEHWSASPAAGAVEIDFGGGGAAIGSGLEGGGAGLFGGGGDSAFGSGDSDFSPVDGGSGGPPAAVLQARAEGPAPVAPAPTGSGGGFGQPEDSDETIMFQPGALDQALLQASLQAAAAEGAPPAEAEAPAQPAAPPVNEAQPAEMAPMPPVDQAFGLDSDDETVMIQPGLLDQALLAEVARAAGSESQSAPPPVEAPPPEPQQVMAQELGASVPDGREVELRLFLHDHALSSEAHLRVLDRLAAADEQVFGPADLSELAGGDARPLLDQFAQSRLVRRTRSPRVRGGSGFVFSPSPATRNTVVRLLRLWKDPQSRPKVNAWLQGA